MPVEVKHISGKYRIVDTDSGGIASSKHNKPADGGGHTDEAKAQRQASYINANVTAKKDE